MIFEVGQKGGVDRRALLYSFDGETSLCAIHLEDPGVAVFDLKQTRLADLAAIPSIRIEVFFFPCVLKALVLTCVTHCYDLWCLIIGKVEHLTCFEAHLHPTDPDGVLPLVETLQSELFDSGQVPHDRGHGPVVLVKSLAFILCLYCELIVFVNDAFAGFSP